MWRTHLCEVTNLDEYLNMAEEEGEEIKSIFYVVDSHQVCIVTKVREDKSIREFLFGQKSD